MSFQVLSMCAHFTDRELCQFNPSLQYPIVSPVSMTATLAGVQHPIKLTLHQAVNTSRSLTTCDFSMHHHFENTTNVFLSDTHSELTTRYHRA